MDLTYSFDATTIRSLIDTMRQSGVHDLRIRNGTSAVHLQLPEGQAAQPVEAITVTAPAFGRLCFDAPAPGYVLPSAGDPVAAGQILAFLDLDGPIIAVRATAPGTLTECLRKVGDLISFKDPLFTLQPS